MKKIAAYINTLRVHWLVEELKHAGVNEIMVTEYFSPLSQISRMQLLCDDKSVETIQSIIHKVGKAGSPADHIVEVADFDKNTLNERPNGRRISPLEE